MVHPASDEILQILFTSIFHQSWNNLGCILIMSAAETLQDWHIHTFLFLRQTEELLWQNLEDTEVTVRRNDGECLRHWSASVIMAMAVAAVMEEKSQELITYLLNEIKRNTQIKLRVWKHKKHLSHYKGYCSLSCTRCIQQHPHSSTPKFTFSSLLIPLKEQGHHDTAKCSASA